MSACTSVTSCKSKIMRSLLSFGTEDRYVVCDVSVFNRQGDLLVVALAVQR